MSDDNHSGGRFGHGSIRHRRRWSLVAVLAIKVAIVALVIALSSGVAISLGAAHGVALVLLLVVAAVVLVLSKRWRRRIFKNRSHK